MYKPLLHWLLQPSLHRLILLDQDTIVLRDPAALWAHFTYFDRALVGAAREQSQLYELGSSGHLRNGMNGGVQLLRLDAMRASIDFNRGIDFFASGHGGRVGALGDQTFYTLLANRHPSLFYKLPCEWNRQLAMESGWNNETIHACPQRCGVLHFNDPHFKCLGRKLQRAPGCRTWHTLIQRLATCTHLPHEWKLKRLLYLARYVRVALDRYFPDCCIERGETNKLRELTAVSLDDVLPRTGGCKLSPWLCVGDGNLSSSSYVRASQPWVGLVS
jgi:hypothetical protein